MKSTVDHIIFMVRDLPRSIEHYKVLLGRNPSWQGSHPAFKTKNALFRLQNTYLELLAEDQETIEKGTSTFVSEHISRHGTGLAGISFGTTDAAAMVTHMQKYGIAALGPMPGEGSDDLTGTVRHWLNAFWPNTAARGIWTFGIQHLDPLDKLPIAPEVSPSDTTVTAVDHVVINTSDSAAAKKFYGDTLGIRLALDLPNHPLGHLMFFRTNKMNLEVVPKDHNEKEDKLWGIAYNTTNVDAAQDRLVKAGVKVSNVRIGMKPGTRVCTVKTHNLDVPTLLIGPDSSKPYENGT